MNIEIRPEPVTQAVCVEVTQALDGANRAKTDGSNGMSDAVDCLWKAAFFRVYADGEAVAFYALRFTKKGERMRADITLAHGRAGFDLVRYILPLIERQCGHCEAVRIETKRAGLVKKLESSGYQRATVTLEKRLCTR